VVPQLESLQQRYRSVLPHYGKSKRLEPPKKPDESMSKELVTARDQLSIIAESYRTIRTALLLSQAEEPPKVILLTSPCPNEGKTMTSLNLGITLAQSGNKVLVIDADLRKGRCHKLVSVKSQDGLANVLTGHLPLRESVQETSIENFYLLPRGALPPNPSDLLMSQKMREVLRDLRESFDFIVVDSPPIIAVSDAAVLSALCDGVLLVFHGQQTTTPAARRAVERLESIGAPILGVILNGIDIRNPDYLDYRSYYPSYYASVREESSPTNGERAHVVKNVEDIESVARKAGVRVMGNIPEVDLSRAKSTITKPVSSNDKRTVPSPFFDRMVRELNAALGPGAPGIVQKQVAMLRESMDSFPMSRAWELTQLVSQEIAGTRVKARFLHTMSEQLRELRST